ncbi:hypothetical protein [Sphingomonas sp. CCH15-F11]|uniref:hypothetical protein n=1 Tax=Sphingomonas sp. CCH15-F11 TaxID=1768785 RepID=UPI00082C9719|nr:hypothetical protein [Sphingomonas sp. CCH15-F11]
MSRPSHDQAEADRLRRCRATFERAVRDNVSMEEARRRIAQERWQAADRRLGRIAPVPSMPARCGTAATFRPTDDSNEGLSWFQR